MKLLVFAHTPPPHHGQSYMVQLMLAGFGGDHRRGATPPTGHGAAGDFGIECYHVNARLSQKLEDIGDFRLSKFLLLIGYCLEAIWCRFRYGVTNFYYVPAPGKRSALYRDWVVMLICRPFFKRVVLHWHAAGLAKWLEMVVGMRSRTLSYWSMKQVDLSIVLSRYNLADAQKLFSRRIAVVGNGIPDPCPRYAEEVLPRRRARFAARKKLLAGQTLDAADLQDTGGDPQVINVLYLAHAMREKGLFDTLSGVALANQRLLQSRAPVSLRLMVAGHFVTAHDQAEFERRVTEPGLAGIVEYCGFVLGEKKNKLLREADLFCFPTFYFAESFGLVLVEAMAFGLPILTTRWHSLPELFPADYLGLVDVHAPEQIADRLLELVTAESGEGFRDNFLQTHSLERHLSSLAEAVKQIELPQPAPVAAAALTPLPK